MLITDPETLTDPDDPRAPSVRLIADAADTGGAVSVENVRLVDGGEGATPHFHKVSHEVFTVVSGTLEMFEDGVVHRLEAGDCAVIPPLTHHAFGAAAGCDADVQIVIAPGVDRFEYFRVLARMVAGQAAPDSLVGRQDEFDTYFVAAPEWTEHRAGQRRS